MILSHVHMFSLHVSSTAVHVFKLTMSVPFRKPPLKMKWGFPNCLLECISSGWLSQTMLECQTRQRSLSWSSHLSSHTVSISLNLNLLWVVSTVWYLTLMKREFAVYSVDKCVSKAEMFCKQILFANNGLIRNKTFFSLCAWGFIWVLWFRPLLRKMSGGSWARGECVYAWWPVLFQLANLYLKWSV